MRAYSMANPHWDEELSFIDHVPDGALTSRLQHIKVGDEIALSAKLLGLYAKEPRSGRQASLYAFDRYRCRTLCFADSR